MNYNDVLGFEAVFIKEELMLPDEETEETKECKLELNFSEDGIVKEDRVDIVEEDPIATVKEDPIDSSETESTVSESPFYCISCKTFLGDIRKCAENFSMDGRYICQACFKILENSKFELLECMKCSDIFVDFNDFQQHHGNCHKLYKCIHCRKEFTKERSLLIHSKYHEMPEPFECVKCQLQYFNLYLFNLHLISHDEGNNFFTCNLCDRVFQYRYNFIFHCFTHLGKNFTCPDCNDTECKTFTDLNDHKLKFHRKKFECSVCKEIFSSRNLRREHFMNFHSVKIRNKYKCTNCDLLFLSLYKLELHLLEEMDGEKRQGIYVCEYCGRKFQSLYLFQYHRLYHTNDLFQCCFCKKKFVNRKDIQLHACFKEKARRKKVKRRQCNICYGYYQTEKELTKHRKYSHNVRRIFPKKQSCAVPFLVFNEVANNEAQAVCDPVSIQF